MLKVYYYINKIENINNKITKIDIYNLLKEKTGEPKNSVRQFFKSII